MEFDFSDSLTSFQEHHSDSIPDLFASEADHMPSKNFFSRLIKTRDYYISFRSEAISLILQAQFSCDFNPFISYLAVNYMDRFVSMKEIPSIYRVPDDQSLVLQQGKPWLSRLLVIACLSLASKMKNSPFSLSDIQREDGSVFDPQTVHKMELLILDALNWRMRSITPFSFFSFFLSLFQLNDPPLTQALKDRASEIIFTSQNDVKFLEFKPSIIAASALLSASHELLPSQFTSFKASLSACHYVKIENLSKCFNMMEEMVMMQGYGSNLDILSSTCTRRNPMSVLESKLSSSESKNSTTTTTESTAQCVSLMAENMGDNKRRKLNGLCSSNSRFQLSQFDQY